MNPEEIVQLVTLLVGIGGTLAPVVFWTIETLVKPFVKDSRLLPFYAIVIGGVVGAVIPFLLGAFGMTVVPLFGSIVAGVVGGAIAMKTYDKANENGEENVD